MHPLQLERKVLLAAIEDLTDLAEDKNLTTEQRIAVVAEATRISVRLCRVQNKIEEFDLD